MKYKLGPAYYKCPKCSYLSKDKRIKFLVINWGTKCPECNGIGILRRL